MITGDKRESFGWILQKVEFIGVIGIVQSYLKNEERKWILAMVLLKLQEKVWERVKIIDVVGAFFTSRPRARPLEP